MVKTVEMIVGLKVPDTTAITALQTLQKIGFSKINGIKRADYYKFSIEGDVEKFKEKIAKVDMLVNANKHSSSFSVPKDNFVKVLVKNINDEQNAILSTLKNRLGFKDLKKIEKGTLWSLRIGAAEKQAKKIAERAAQDLLVNEHYQGFTIL